MINLKDDIQPLTTFRNNSAKMLKRLKKTGRPMVLTVNGKSEMIVQSVEAYQQAEEAYQQMLDRASEADIREAIRQGEDDIAAGRTRPVEQFLAEFRERHGLPRRDFKKS